LRRKTGVCTDGHEIHEGMGRCSDAPPGTRGCGDCWLAIWFDEETVEPGAMIAHSTQTTSKTGEA